MRLQPLAAHEFTGQTSLNSGSKLRIFLGKEKPAGLEPAAYFRAADSLLTLCRGR
jgi:hypothetical protein